MVTLRLGVQEDLGRVLEWNAGNDEGFLMQWAGPLFRHPLTEDQLLAHWGPVIAGRQPETRLYGIEEGQTIGVVELTLIDRTNRSARVARVLLGSDEDRGHGTGAAALKLLLEVCFGELELNRVSLAVFDFNIPAIRCYEKVGFRKEGLIREARRVGEDYWSYFEMGILRREWLSGEIGIIR
ncbi:MAG TPA: GNAT family protein [Spirochaetia bacterium]|nr:GNAT family protein [Spirochaetia bacterium]